MKLTFDQNNQRINQYGKDVPLGQKPNQDCDAVDAMLFLGSDDARMITGETLVVDGGQSQTTNRHYQYLEYLKNPTR